MVGGARPKSLRAQSCPTAAAPPYAGPAALLPCRTWGRESRLRQSPRHRGAGTLLFHKSIAEYVLEHVERLALAEVAAMKLVESCSSPCTLSPPMLLSPPPAPRMGESMILGVLWGGIRLVGIDVGLG